MTKNGYFYKYAKSSAALVSLGIHALLIVLALSFVAVTVITKEAQVFEAKAVKRPRMQMKRLQVPVNVKKKKTQKPKLRKRIVVQPKLNQAVPDIKMPEINGVKGGMGSAGTGLGGAGSLGFSMPEMNLFGIKSRGEKVFIILDASAPMMVDEMGGIPAYTIIKSELVRILEGLNSTVLFNIAVYGGGDVVLFPDLVPATPSNVDKVDAWLKPLNAATKGMGDKDYGTKTLGTGGTRFSGDFKIEPFQNEPGVWARPTLLAMKQQADVVFVLTSQWGGLYLRYKSGTKDRDWDESDQQKYEGYVAKARGLLKKENELRRTKGQPPRVIPRGDRGLVQAYFPNARRPVPGNTYVYYTPDQMVEAFGNNREKWNSKTATSSGLGKKKKDKYSINVIHFVKESSGSEADSKLVRVASETRGEYRKIKGLESIKSYVFESSIE